MPATRTCRLAQGPDAAVAGILAVCGRPQTRPPATGTGASHEVGADAKDPVPEWDRAPGLPR